MALHLLPSESSHSLPRGNRVRMSDNQLIDNLLNDHYEYRPHAQL